MKNSTPYEVWVQVDVCGKGHCWEPDDVKYQTLAEAMTYVTEIIQSNIQSDFYRE